MWQELEQITVNEYGAAADKCLGGFVNCAGSHVVGPLLAGTFHDERWSDCEVKLVAGGKSNLTFVVRSAAGEAVLRRPPLSHVLPTAHDMRREHTVISALRATPVPVPRALLYRAAGDSPLGAPFYVMERVLGHVCREALPPGYADTPGERRAIGNRLVDVLADLHRVDPVAVGLDEFGHPDGFMARQIRRWGQQWEASKTAELPALEELRDELAARVPKPQAATIVHGDYRLDNTVLHPVRPGEVVAVLDWEMSTLGDPLADFGTTVMYWAQADDGDELAAVRVAQPVTAAEGFPTRRQIADRYAERTGFDLAELPFYVAFAFFKMAVVVQGIVARVAGGAMLGEGFEGMAERIAPLVDLGRATLADRKLP
jgi:aminoglycoside phosphotransferase (APT) family kinase protein